MCITPLLSLLLVSILFVFLLLLLSVLSSCYFFDEYNVPYCTVHDVSVLGSLCFQYVLNMNMKTRNCKSVLWCQFPKDSPTEANPSLFRYTFCKWRMSLELPSHAQFALKSTKRRVCVVCPVAPSRSSQPILFWVFSTEPALRFVASYDILHLIYKSYSP